VLEFRKLMEQLTEREASLHQIGLEFRNLCDHLREELDEFTNVVRAIIMQKNDKITGLKREISQLKDALTKVAPKGGEGQSKSD